MSCGAVEELTAPVARRGPTGTLLNELAEASHEPADCEVIFVRSLQCWASEEQR